jgi:hypothetical protein
MKQQRPENTRPKRALSMHPITPEQALLAALRIEPANLKELEEKGRMAKEGKKQS